MKQINIYRSLYKTPAVTLTREDGTTVGSGPYNIIRKPGSVYTIAAKNIIDINNVTGTDIPPIPKFGTTTGQLSCPDLDIVDKDFIRAAPVVRALPLAGANDSDLGIAISRFFKRNPAPTRVSPVMCKLFSETYRAYNKFELNLDKNTEGKRAEMRDLIDLTLYALSTNLITDVAAQEYSELVTALKRYGRFLRST